MNHEGITTKTAMPCRTLFTVLLTLVMTVSLTACAATLSETVPAHLGEALTMGLNRQVLHPAAPTDRSPADGIPGDLATQIHKKRYLKAMTEKDDEDDQKKASREFQ
jgi:hypothetical protein